MKNERERPKNEGEGPGSQGERLKNGWEVVGEEGAETKNEREETKFGSATSAERFAEAADEWGGASSSRAESRRQGAGEAEAAVVGPSVRHCLARILEPGGGAAEPAMPSAAFFQAISESARNSGQCSSRRP